MRKFMQTIGDQTWKDLVKEAQDLDMSVQALIRYHIVPDWLKSKK